MLMRTILGSIKKGSLRQMIYLMIVTMGIIGLAPNLGEASVIPADQTQKAAVRADNEARIKAALEKQEVAARLADYGLTPEEVSSRLTLMSDQQIAELAAMSAARKKTSRVSWI